MEPHIKFGTTLPELKQAAEANQIPLDVRERDGRAEAPVPLDGFMTGEQLRFRFFADGELREVSIVGRSGETERLLMKVKK